MNKTISKEQYKGMAIFTPIICGRYWQSLPPGHPGLGWPRSPKWWGLAAVVSEVQPPALRGRGRKLAGRGYQGWFS